LSLRMSRPSNIAFMFFDRLKEVFGSPGKLTIHSVSGGKVFTVTHPLAQYIVVVFENEVEVVEENKKAPNYFALVLNRFVLVRQTWRNETRITVFEAPSEIEATLVQEFAKKVRQIRRAKEAKGQMSILGDLELKAILGEVIREHIRKKALEIEIELESKQVATPVTLGLEDE